MKFLSKLLTEEVHHPEEYNRTAIAFYGHFQKCKLLFFLMLVLYQKRQAGPLLTFLEMALVELDLPMESDRRATGGGRSE